MTIRLRLKAGTIALTLAAGVGLAAQTSPPPVRPAAPVPLVPAAAKSPVVHPDGSVDFRLEMPHAKEVTLSLEGFAKPFAMAQDPAGVWTYTAPPLKPEFYAYTFTVDGTNVVDPQNQTVKTSFFRVENTFLVPGGKPWERTDVPHGVVHHHLYRSAVVGAESEYYVYTPPGFQAGAKTTYPVLYLLHGYSDDASAWTAMAKANLILDNLIAAGKAKPMIVVMPLAYGSMEMITQGWVAWRDVDLVRLNFRRFGEALYGEVMPRVKADYPLSARRDDHAVAGLSMGGAESLLVGLNHPEDFAYVAGFSAGGLGESHFDLAFPAITPESGAALNGKLRLLWISCGTEDGLLDPNRKFVAWLKERNIAPMVVETPGMHVWTVWRDNLSNLLPLLFTGK